MSHRRDCVDSYEARRQGERAFDRGYDSGSNQFRDGDYSESYDDRRCREEAESNWRRGYYNAEAQAEEEAAQRRAEQRQSEERAAEQSYYEDAHAEEQQRQEYYEHEDAQKSDDDLPF